MYYCYILKSLNEKYKDDTYIGFTDNPLHRIRQHNGLIKGGAKKTSKKRPWTIVLVISNFPNKIIALKFEWAWQNPFRSTFLKETIDNMPLPSIIKTKNKKKYSTSLPFKLCVLNQLMNTKVFEKIYLYIYAFDSEITGKEFLGLNSYKILEKVDEESFKESIKRKVYNYTKEINSNEENDIEMNGDNDLSEYKDKCILCDEIISKDSMQKESDEEDNEVSDNNNDENMSQTQGMTVKKPKIKETPQTLVNCPHCSSTYHMLCLASYTLDNTISLIPKETICIICGKTYIWSQWLCNQNISS